MHGHSAARMLQCLDEIAFGLNDRCQLVNGACRDPVLDIGFDKALQRGLVAGILFFAEGLVETEAQALQISVDQGIGFLVLQAGWRLLVGSNAQDPSRQIVIWRDPVRSLAEAAGVDVDPAGEIAPSKGTRIQEVDIPVGAASRAPTSTQAP